jgi:predicted PurR-regulated permease PerM
MPKRKVGTPPADDDDGRIEKLVADLDWRSVAVALTAFVALVVGTGLVRSVPRVVTAIAVGGLLALALNPLIDGVQRRASMRRGFAVAVVLAGFVLAIALLAVLLGPPAIREARQLQQDIPGVVRDLEDLPVIGDDLARNDVPEKVENWLQELPERLGGETDTIESVARSVLGGAIAATGVILVTITLLLDGERIVRAARRIVPRQHRARADRIGQLFYQVVGRYFAGSLLVAVIAGLVVLMVGLALGVPLTPLLAVWVAVFDLVPQIGGAAGGIPFVLLAVTQGPIVGLAAAAFFILYLQFENHILQPLIVGQAVDLSPPATMVAALIGVSAGGVPGALVAVPTLGAAKAIYLELRDPVEAARRARTREQDRGWLNRVRRRAARDT